MVVQTFECPAALANARSLSQFVSDIARSISELPLAEPEVSKEKSKVDPCGRIPHMAGSASCLRLRRKQAGSRHSSQPARKADTDARCRYPQPLRLAALAPCVSKQLPSARSASKKKCGNRALLGAFQAFAQGREHMYWKDFELLCSTTLMYDAQFMVLDARLMFNDVMAEGERFIGPEQFVELLTKVSYKRQRSSSDGHRNKLEVVHHLVCGCVKSNRT